MVDEIGRHISDLRLATVRIARRQHNLHLAEKLLIEEVCSTVSAQSEDEGATGITSARSALSRIYTSNSAIERVKLLRIEREVAKLLHARGQHRDAIETLSTSIVNEATGLSAGAKDTVAVCQQLNTRSLLSLVQWLQLDHKNLSALASQLKVIGQGDEVGVTAVARNVKLLLELEEAGARSQKGLVLQEQTEHGMFHPTPTPLARPRHSTHNPIRQHNPTRSPTTPPDHPQPHQITHNPTRSPTTPPDHPQHHQITHNPTRSPTTPPDHPQPHQITHNTTRPPTTPPDHPQHHQITHNTTRPPTSLLDYHITIRQLTTQSTHNSFNLLLPYQITLATIPTPRTTVTSTTNSPMLCVNH